MSLDIGHSNGKFFLFEFQCLCLGQYTLEKSKFYYKHSSDGWNRVYETPDLEREISSNVIKYIEKYIEQKIRRDTDYVPITNKRISIANYK